MPHSPQLPLFPNDAYSADPDKSADSDLGTDQERVLARNAQIQSTTTDSRGDVTTTLTPPSSTLSGYEASPTSAAEQKRLYRERNAHRVASPHNMSTVPPLKSSTVRDPSGQQAPTEQTGDKVQADLEGLVAGQVKLSLPEQSHGQYTTHPHNSSEDMILHPLSGSNGDNIGHARASGNTSGNGNCKKNDTLNPNPIQTTAYTSASNPGLAQPIASKPRGRSENIFVPTLSGYLAPQAYVHFSLSVIQVAKIFGVSKATIWNWTKNKPDFPKPVRVSSGTTRWRDSDIRDFQTKIWGE